MDNERKGKKEKNIWWAIGHCVQKLKNDWLFSRSSCVYVYYDQIIAVDYLLHASQNTFFYIKEIFYTVLFRSQASLASLLIFNLPLYKRVWIIHFILYPFIALERIRLVPKKNMQKYWNKSAPCESVGPALELTIGR